MLNQHMMSVATASRHKDAAWEWVKWSCSAEFSKARAMAGRGGPVGMAPTTCQPVPRTSAQEHLTVHLPQTGVLAVSHLCLARADRGDPPHSKTSTLRATSPDPSASKAALTSSSG
jgi:hypothetical protein